MNWQTSTLRYHRYGATWVRDDQIAAIGLANAWAVYNQEDQ